MEIIEPSKDFSNWTKEIECPRCEAILKFSESDIIVKLEDKFYYYPIIIKDLNYYLNCLACEYQMEVLKEDLPMIFLEKINKKYIAENILERSGLTFWGKIKSCF